MRFRFCETRPRLQGLKLNAWEPLQDVQGVPCMAKYVKLTDYMAATPIIN